jgi:hypothetical protein
MGRDVHHGATKGAIAAKVSRAQAMHRFVKAILGYAFPVPSKDAESGLQSMSLKMGTPSRSVPDLWALNPAN